MLVTDQIDEVRRKAQLPERSVWTRLGDDLRLGRGGPVLLLALVLVVCGAVVAYLGHPESAIWVLLFALVLLTAHLVTQFVALLFSDRAADFSRLFTESAVAEMPLVNDLLTFDEAAIQYVHQEYVDRITLIETATTLLTGPLRTAGLLGVLAATATAVITILKEVPSPPWWLNIFWGLPLGFIGAGLLIDDTLNGLRRRRDLLNRVATLRAALP
ncbi:hypothetical protein [Deinococcus sp. UYEF24]